jgi:transaldolase
MRIFLDTADLEELRKVAAWGVVDGVTTNPTLIAKEGRAAAERIREIGELVAAAMLAEGREIACLHPNVVVKCPLTRDGIQAAAALAGADIASMPFKVLDMMFNHPLTDLGLEQFLKDYRQVYGAGA